MTSAAPDWLPLGFEGWSPVAQATTLGLLTFVQEDVPTVTGALLAAAGSLSWMTSFLGVFLGIWIGDALLYLLARGVGRPLLKNSWAKRLLHPDAVTRSERWFDARGTWLLVSSRFVPGTRLPTYLAAGFLKLPFQRFLLVTGIAVGIWTVGIFLVASWVGPELLRWLQQWNSGSWIFALLVVALVLAVRTVTTLANPGARRRIAARLGRWTRWEFWPAWLFYLPVALNYLRLAVKYRGITVPTAANPGIFSGGFVGESKIATLHDLQRTSPEFTAETFLLRVEPRFEERQAMLVALLREHHIGFPFILKPDVGQRGVGVKLIRTLDEAAAYLRGTNAPLLVQQYAPGPGEVGVFYYRFPHESRGRIFAITEKIFPTVTGDGRRTIEGLVWDDARARFVAEIYLRRLSERRSEVLPDGETLRLVEAGNHAQGCIFRDGMALRSEALEERIDQISRRIDGFFIGRYDIRYASDDDLRAGHSFQIIELNGAASEATSIYDSRNSLAAAYRKLFQQWELVFAIGAENRRRGSKPAGLALLWRKWRETDHLIATYPLAD